MKHIFILIAGTIGLLYGRNSLAQEVEVQVTDTTIQRTADTTCCGSDTSRIGPVTVIVQNKDDQPSSTKVIIGGTDSSRHKRVNLTWFGFDLGLNNYVDRSNYGSAEVNDFAPGSPEATATMFSLRTGKSVNVNIWPVLLKVDFNRYFGFKTGIGIEMNNYRYTKNITYENDISKTYIFRDTVNFKKNKLFTEYLTIPLMLTYESNPYHSMRSFHLSAGATFGYLVKSRTKQKSKEFGKVKNNDPFNLEKFRTGVRAEVGYGPVTLYGAYSFTPIHQYGLEQYPFSIGLSLIR